MSEIGWKHYITNSKGIIQTKQLLQGRTYFHKKIIKCSQVYELFISNVIAQRQEFSQQSLLTSELLMRTIQLSSNQHGERRFQMITPHVRQTSIIKYISTSLSLTPEPLTKEEKARRINEVVSKLILLLLTSSNHQLYTIESLIFENIQKASRTKIKINKTSIVGMELILQNKQISKQSFIEIYELLGSKILQKSEEKRLTIQQKFRAIGLMILSMIIEKRLSVFDQQKWNSDKTLNHMKKYKQFLAEGPKRFKEFLTNSQVKQLILKVQNFLQVNYLQFLYDVFVNEKEFKWSRAIELLCQKQKSLPIDNLPLDVIQMAKQTKRIKIEFNSRQQARLKELGLLEQSQLRIYLISLLSKKWPSAEILLGYQNLNEFIYNQDKLNFKEREIIFDNLIKILSGLAECIPHQYTQQFMHPQSDSSQNENSFNNNSSEKMSYKSGDQIKLAQLFSNPEKIFHKSGDDKDDKMSTSLLTAQQIMMRVGKLMRLHYTMTLHEFHSDKTPCKFPQVRIFQNWEKYFSF